MSLWPPRNRVEIKPSRRFHVSNEVSAKYDIKLVIEYAIMKVKREEIENHVEIRGKALKIHESGGISSYEIMLT